MDWIFDNFQIVILVALALASWVKTRMDAKAAEREEQQAREEMGEGELYGPPEDWEQEVQPVPSLPQPPPVLHTARSMAAAEAARQSDAVLKHQMDLQERLRQMRENKAVTTGGAAAVRSRVAAKSGPRPGDAKVVSYKHLIGNRKSLRNAIVTREILGKPVGLR